MDKKPIIYFLFVSIIGISVGITFIFPIMTLTDAAISVMPEIKTPQLVDKQMVTLFLTVSICSLMVGVYFYWRKSQQLKTCENRLAMTLNASQDAVIGINLAGEITDWNKAAQDIFLYSPAQAIGKSLIELLVPLNQHEHEKWILSQLCLGIPVTQFESQRLNRKGELLAVLVTASVIKNNNDRMISLMMTITDINREVIAQRLHQEKLAAVAIDANKAKQVKSDFLANMSHEIRTPMNVFFGMLQLLKKTALNKNQLNYLQKTEDSANDLLFVIEDILDFSKIDTGKLELQLTSSNLQKILNNVKLIIESRIAKKPIEVIFDIETDLPENIVFDETRLQQVLLNLGSNAIKFTESGQVKLKVKHSHFDDNTLLLAFDFSDTGIGIASDKLSSIFDGFTQVETSTTRRYDGSGLGLAICQQLVNLMGGQLAVESELTVGSRFYFSLVCPIGKPKKPVLPSYLQDLNILVVDDNPSARNAIKDTVATFGWRVDAVESGAAAIRKIEDSLSTEHDNDEYHLILMDWQMPEMNGFEASEKIRQIYLNRKTPPIIMVTGYDIDGITQQPPHKRAMINACLTKPVSASALMICCTDLIKKFRLEEIKIIKPRLSEMNILLVEDNAANLLVAKELLESEGAIVTTAESGEEAIKRLKNTPNFFDLVLMDIQMPGMDGYQTTREIRQTLGLNQLLILAMTANVLTSDREQALDSGMNDHIGKPFDLDLLVNKIIQICNRQSLVTITQPALLAGSNEINRSDIVQQEINQQETDKRQVSDDNLDENKLHQEKSDQHKYDEDNLFNYESSLERFNGQKEIYHRALSLFCQESVLLLASLPQHWLNLDRSKLFTSLHSLKGSAATMGAALVAKQCREIETSLAFADAIQLENPLPKSDELSYKNNLTQLKSIYAATELLIQEKIAVKSTVNKSKVSAPKTCELSSSMLQLSKLLVHSDLDALNLHQKLFNQFASTRPELFRLLDESINQMKFAEAENICHKIHASLVH